MSRYSARRRKLIRLWDGKCIYCERVVKNIKTISKDPLTATCDHWKPKAHKGTNGYHNYVLSCLECNEDKAWCDPFVYLLSKHLTRDTSIIGVVRGYFKVRLKQFTIERKLKQNAFEIHNIILENDLI